MRKPTPGIELVIRHDLYGKTEIAFLEGRQNSECYTKTLGNYLTAFLDTLHENHGFLRPIFQQDNAASHESKFTKAHIETLGIRKVKWRRKSPDLHPIENVWD
ncbi:transposable element Tc3 Transposase [Phytophthora palmivora]|uniref:Transposable element Tc3 Transposase n=1 Tax=Phytophthora palmivora TaxID=4796 RepID=A0A2P4Y978_9STRA|nr:transposable element Tc3 Transposase [Phytophthora palmivora]